ncbi:hypothetical protein XENOCAPTIV_001569, partial [Xenoophorus captivus]
YSILPQIVGSSIRNGPDVAAELDLQLEEDGFCMVFVSFYYCHRFPRPTQNPDLGLASVISGKD